MGTSKIFKGYSKGENDNFEMCKNGQDIHVRPLLHGFASPSMRLVISIYMYFCSQSVLSNKSNK